MLRKKLESESGTEIVDPEFLMIYEKPADSGFGLPSLLMPVINNLVKSWIIHHLKVKPIKINMK